MLRPIKSSYIRPRVLGFKVSNSGTPSVSDGCKDDVTSVTDNGAGDFTLNLRDPFQRTPIAVASPVATGGVIPNVTAVAGGSVRVVTNTSGGAGSDGDAHVLVVGYDSSETKMVKPNYHQVRAGRLKPVTFGVLIEDTGSVTNGFKHVSCSLAANLFTITLTNPFATPPVVVGTIIGSAAGVVRVESTSNNQILVRTYDADGNPQNFQFFLLITGWYSSEYARSHRSILQCPQRGARLIALTVDYTGGVPAITTNSQEASISDDATGYFTLTYTEKFKRAGEVIAVANGTDICSVLSNDVHNCEIQAYSNAGVEADPDIVHVFILGYDVAEEF